MSFLKRIFSTKEWRVIGYTKQHRLSVTGSWGEEGWVKVRAAVLENQFGVRRIKGVIDAIDYAYSVNADSYKVIDKLISNEKQNLIYSSMTTRKLNTYDGFDLCMYHDAAFDWESFNDEFIYGEIDLDGSPTEKVEMVPPGEE